jgi:hypothetical protein
MKILFFLLGILNVSEAFAGYERTGPMKATICSGLVIKSCQQKEVFAVEQDGALYEPSTFFNSVTSFSGRNCTINTSSNNLTISATQKLILPTFYTREAGQLVKIKPDYVSFNCIKK